MVDLGPGKTLLEAYFSTFKFQVLISKEFSKFDLDIKGSGSEVLISSFN